MRSYEWVDDIASKTIIELKKTSDILEEMHNQFFAKYGISNTKFNVLVILYKGPEEGVILSEIGEQMLVTKANITGLIDRLEKHGFVRRIRDEHDRRKIVAEITKEGKIFLEEVMESYKDWTQNILGDLGQEEKGSLINLLKKMQQGLIDYNTF